MPKLKHIAKANSIKTISPPIFISPIDRRKELVEKLKSKTRTMNKITKVKCKLYNRWFWSVESAGLLIESPAGGHVWIKKSAFNVPGVSVDAQQLIHTIGNSGDGIGDVELTVEQMEHLLTVAKLVRGCFYKTKHDTQSVYTTN